MLFPLDGPSIQGVLSAVDTVTPVEVKVGASPFEERKVVTLQGDDKFYVYFGDEDASAPNAATVTAQGFTVFKNQLTSFEAKYTQPIYVLALSGTVNIRIVERA